MYTDRVGIDTVVSAMHRKEKAMTNVAGYNVDEPEPSSWNNHVEKFIKEMESVLLDRGDQYGERQKNFQNIADIWSIILGIEVNPRQVANCMVGMKLAREVAGPKHDSMIDVANYALIADSLN